jgi:uncharacterized protein (DUF697 family)
MNTATVDVDVVETLEVPSTKIEAAANLISAATKWSVAASVIPVPTLDVLAVGAVQVNLVTDLAHLYGSTFKQESVKAVVSALLGMLVPAGAASVVVKLVPGIGTIAGIISLAGFSAAATYAIGKVFVAHFENGGTLDNFSPEAVKADLQKEFKKAAKTS